MGVAKGLATVTAFQVKPGCRSSESSRRQPASEAEARTMSFTKMAQLLGAAMQFDPSMRADVNFDKAFRGAYEGTGAPAENMRCSRPSATTRVGYPVGICASDCGSVTEEPIIR